MTFLKFNVNLSIGVFMLEELIAKKKLEIAHKNDDLIAGYEAELNEIEMELSSLKTELNESESFIEEYREPTGIEKIFKRKKVLKIKIGLKKQKID